MAARAHRMSLVFVDDDHVAAALAPRHASLHKELKISMVVCVGVAPCIHHQRVGSVGPAVSPGTELLRRRCGLVLACRGPPLYPLYAGTGARKRDSVMLNTRRTARHAAETVVWSRDRLGGFASEGCFGGGAISAAAAFPERIVRGFMTS